MATANPGRAVMFIDVSDSTALYESLGDEQTHAYVRACLAGLTRVAQEFGGWVIKTTGDGLMCAFADAGAAIQAGAAMHVRNAERHAAGDATPGIHIGCHFGPVIESAGDLFGASVNVAARVAGLARVGQIITTEDTVKQLSPLLRHRTRNLVSIPVRGRSGEVAVYEVLWQDTEDITIHGVRFGSDDAATLVLRHEEREVRLDRDSPGAITLGRDSTCDIVVADRRASRQHARIERRRGRIVLMDHSSNGTSVRIAGELEVVLRREELMLRGAGQIALGHSTGDPDAVLVEFECA
jgi:class 3 adenylate cyclase